jgi:hypothetical protein
MEYLEYLGYASAVIGFFAVLARFTENKSDDKVLQFLMDVINMLGQNGGKAKNR